MKARDKGRVWMWISLFLVAGAAILAGYFIGKEKGRAEADRIASKQIPLAKSMTPKVEIKTPPEPDAANGPLLREKIPEPPAVGGEDYCRRIQNDVIDLFSYLDKKNYLRHLEDEIHTQARFTKLMASLAASPPIPAGEGIDSKIITKNIFHFFRVLSKKDLRLLREIIRNEADTLEINLELFYRWFTLSEQCPELEEKRPSLDVLYQYAGFLLNTIGGRAYLYRRPLGLRLLVSYYCLVIINDADKKGRNTYGIDIYPLVASLLEEIRVYPDFLFQNEYIQGLERLSNYYAVRR